MRPAQGHMLSISSLTPLLPPASLLTPFTPATQLPQCSQCGPGTRCLEAIFQLPLYLEWELGTWQILGITQMRFDFSRIVITDPQLPSNFAQWHLHEMSLAPQLHTPFSYSCYFIIFTSTYHILIAMQLTHLVWIYWKSPHDKMKAPQWQGPWSALFPVTNPLEK